MEATTISPMATETTFPKLEKQMDDLMSKNKLKLEADRRNAILILGYTGVGKSTLAEILFGDLSTLQATKEGMRVKIKRVSEEPLTEPEPLSPEQSSFISATISPQLFTEPCEPGIAVYDCPGFMDNRGTLNEIATAIYLAKIVEHAHAYKLVLTVPYTAVDPDVDRNAFIENVLQVLDIVKQAGVYNGGVFLLVNRYANPFGDFSEDEIINGIAEFLQKAHQFLVVKKLPERKSEIDALFNNSWLQKSQDGKYTNIGFFRTVVQQGPLNKIEAVVESRTRILHQLFHNPHFNFIARDPQIGFGCTLSPNAKLEIEHSRTKLLNQLESLLACVANKVTGKFEKSWEDKLQLTRFLRYFATFLDALERLEAIGTGLSAKSLEVVRQLGSKMQLDTDVDLSQLEDVLGRMAFISGFDATESAAFWQAAQNKMDHFVTRMEEKVCYLSGVVIMFPSGPVCV